MVETIEGSRGVEPVRRATRPSGRPGPDAAETRAGGPPPGASWARALAALVYLGMLAVCAQGLWRTSLWKAAEPRVMAVSRGQLAHGLLHTPEFAGMPFLEKPPLYFDLNALAFLVAGGPSVTAARVVVVLLALLWVAATVLTVRRVAGPGAGRLAGALLVCAPAFSELVRRLSVDVALAAFLSLALMALLFALTEDRERIGGRWWWTALGAAGAAALTKGPFATFLFVVPTVAYALVARDRRLGAALLRPATLLVLALPHLAWGLVLARDGGTAFVFEHFVNNTLGRVLHTRFSVAGTGELAYGDVGAVYDRLYYLRTIPLHAMPALLAVPFAVTAQRARGGLRARDGASRLTVLALCLACVPPLVLSFSAYKGRGHLAVSSTALVVVAALWLGRRLPALRAEATSRRALAGLAALLAAAPILVIAAPFGLPATPTVARVLSVAIAATGVLGIGIALRRRAPARALTALLAAAAAGWVLDFSPGANVGAQARNSLDSAATWVAAEVGDRPLGIAWSSSAAAVEADARGLVTTDEQVLGSLATWRDAPLVHLHGARAVAAFLARETPAYFVVGGPTGERPDPLRDEALGAGVGWASRAFQGDHSVTLIANRAAAAGRSAPVHAPPGATPPGGRPPGSRPPGTEPVATGPPR